MIANPLLRALAGIVLACAMAPAFAEPRATATAPEAGTGDAWIDRQLVDMDRYGERYRDAFVDELVRYHNAPRDLVLVLIERDWPPGDVYYACALANVAGRPCRYVVDQYTQGDAPNWQAIARQIGVEPDSAQFRRLRQGIEATYRRWGRPLASKDAAATRASGAAAPTDAARAADPASPPRKPRVAPEATRKPDAAGKPPQRARNTGDR